MSLWKSGYVCIAPTPPSTTAILRVLNSIKFSSVWLSWEMERGDEGGRRVRSFPSDSFVSGLSSCNPFRQNILHNPPSFLPSLSLVGSTFLRIGRPRPHICHAFTGFIFENNDEEPDSFHAVDRPFFIAHSLIIFPAAQANWKHLFSSLLRHSGPSVAANAQISSAHTSFSGPSKGFQPDSPLFPEAFGGHGETPECRHSAEQRPSARGRKAKG